MKMFLSYRQTELVSSYRNKKHFYGAFMYEELTKEEAMRLACKHLNRGQEIPQELMKVLSTYGIAEYFTTEADESGSEGSD